MLQSIRICMLQLLIVNKKITVAMCYMKRLARVRMLQLLIIYGKLQYTYTTTNYKQS